MSQVKPPNRVEQSAGNVLTESALTAIAAVAGGPLAALLPVLAKSLASKRQRVRVESALVEISRVLDAHESQIQDLTDAQYKLVNEAVLALLQTTQFEKLTYLRSAVTNALDMRDLRPQEATLLSRVIRDISAEEAAFVVKHFAFDGFHLMAAPEGQKFSDNILRVNPSSHEALLVSGLLSLGLVLPAEPTYGALNVLRFSGIVVKLIALLKPRDA